jgi:hypothetical protein
VLPGAFCDKETEVIAAAAHHVQWINGWFWLMVVMIVIGIVLRRVL